MILFYISVLDVFRNCHKVFVLDCTQFQILYLRCRIARIFGQIISLDAFPYFRRIWSCETIGFLIFKQGDLSADMPLAVCAPPLHPSMNIVGTGWQNMLKCHQMIYVWKKKFSNRIHLMASSPQTVQHSG